MPLQIDIGIEAGDRKAIADGLSRLLADSYTLDTISPPFNAITAG